ncbi:hypothetical protein A3Q56_00990 [Intoshia linei]|uniref:G-protein coupled receptors family 1 profile domain-containing protein n=1 Tax=Intoshia linei TaxID=1819745 RepID=A0A177BC75_9BILA|nr:hypothetical protein A3Q56_00990 [Intoshia linei]
MIGLIVMLGIFAFVGVIGNGLVIIVYTSIRCRNINQKFLNFFILQMTIADFIVCLVLQIFSIYMEYNQWTVEYDWICKLYQFVVTSYIPYSIFLTVAIAVERFITICFPFHRRTMTLFRAKIVCLLCFIMSISLSLVVVLMYGTYKKMIGFSQQFNTSQLNVTQVKSFHISGFNVTKIKGMQLSGLSMGQFQFLNLSRLNTYQLKSLNISVNTYYTGICQPTFIHFSQKFMTIYQTVYSNIFLVCLLLVLILYIFLFRKIVKQRNKAKKLKSGYQIINKKLENKKIDNKLINSITKCGSRLKPYRKKKDIYLQQSKINSLIANLKTAIMLFVVTLNSVCPPAEPLYSVTTDY